MTYDRLSKSGPTLAEPDRMPIAVRAFAPPPPKPGRLEPSLVTRSGKAHSAFRVDARLRYGNDRRRSAAVTHWRLPIPQWR